MKVAFAGAFAVRLAERVRAHLTVPCEVVLVPDEDRAVDHLAETDVLVTLGFTPAMGAAARRLVLVQVPGAGLDRIDRSAVPAASPR